MPPAVLDAFLAAPSMGQFYIRKSRGPVRMARMTDA
ncbi:KTSC domain-containing protein [Bradyrhizobium uaiense]